MHSQNDEEAFVLAAVRLREPGRVLDIGAWDGLTFSNTAALLASGWGGVLVEPAPGPFAKLLDRYGAREDIVLVNAAVTPERRIAEFWEASGDAVSTLEMEHRRKWSDKVPFRRMFLQTLPLSELLGRWPGPYEVVSIDAEGTSWAIWAAMPFEELGTRAVVVEHDGRVVEVTTRGKNLGFRVADVNAENVVLVR